MQFAAITGWGEGLPPAVLTNDDLSTFLETSDEWITTRTGMKERRISHVSAIEMATVAAARALACAGLDAADVDLIVYGGCSNEEVGAQQRVGRAGRARRHARRGDGSQHRVHELPLRPLRGDGDDSERHRPQRRRDRRRADHALHGLEQPQRRRALRRRRGRGRRSRRPIARKASIGSVLGCDAEARADAARARHRLRLRRTTASRSATRCGTSTARRSSSAPCKGMSDACERVMRQVPASPATRSTSSCRTRPTCASSNRWPSTPACRWSSVIVTVQKYGNMSAATVPVALVEALERGARQARVAAADAGLRRRADVRRAARAMGQPHHAARGIAGGLSAGTRTALEMVNAVRATAGSEWAIGGRPCGAGVRRDTSRLGLRSGWSRSLRYRPAASAASSAASIALFSSGVPTVTRSLSLNPGLSKKRTSTPRNFSAS